MQKHANHHRQYPAQNIFKPGQSSSHASHPLSVPNRGISMGKLNIQVVSLEISSELPKVRPLLPTKSSDQSLQHTFLSPTILKNPDKLMAHAANHANQTFLVRKADIHDLYKTTQHQIQHTNQQPMSLAIHAAAAPDRGEQQQQHQSSRQHATQQHKPGSDLHQSTTHQQSLMLFKDTGVDSNQTTDVISVLAKAPTVSLATIAQDLSQERRAVFDRTTSKPLVLFSPPRAYEMDAIIALGRGNHTPVKQMLAYHYLKALQKMGITPPDVQDIIHGLDSRNSDQVFKVPTSSTSSSTSHRDVSSQIDMKKYELFTPNELEAAYAYIASLPPQTIQLIRGSAHFEYDINAQFTKGGSILHHACLHGQIDIIPFLLEHGAEVNLRTSNNSTPLHWAAGAGWLDVVRVLVEHGADIHANTSTWCVDVFGRNSGQLPIHWAASSGHDAIVQYLHELSPVMITCSDEKDNSVLELSKKSLHLSTISTIQSILAEEYVPVTLRVFSKTVLHDGTWHSPLTDHVLQQNPLRLSSPPVDASTDVFHPNSTLH